MRRRVLSLALAILAVVATQAPAQTRRTARIQVRNSTGTFINQLVVRHRYADRFSSDNVYENTLVWMNVPDGGLTFAQSVDYRTGAVTTAVDWWEVTWVSDGPSPGAPLSYSTTNDTLEPMVHKRVLTMDIQVPNAAQTHGWLAGWTSHWLQHILRAEDAGRITTIELKANGEVSYRSPSGSSTDNYYTVAGSTRQRFTMGVATLGNRLFVAQQNQLYEFDLNRLTWIPIAGVAITNAHLLIGSSDAMFYIENGRLYRLDRGANMYVTPLDGQSPGNWREASAMTWLDGSLYIVARSNLFQVDPTTGRWSERNGQSAGGWPSTAGVAAAGSGLYIVTEDKLYRADPNTGVWAPRHGQAAGGWPAVAAMTSLDGALFIVTGDQLYFADPAQGAWSPRVGQRRGAWSGTEAMTGLNGRLYIAQRGILHRVNPSTGDWETLGAAPIPTHQP